MIRTGQYGAGGEGTGEKGYTSQVLQMCSSAAETVFPKLVNLLELD